MLQPILTSLVVGMIILSLAGCFDQSSKFEESLLPKAALENSVLEVASGSVQSHASISRAQYRQPLQVRLPDAKNNPTKTSSELIGYQFGTYHYAHAIDCNAPQIVSEASTPVLLEYLQSESAIAVVFGDAVSWVRRSCGFRDAVPITITAEIRVLGELQAKLKFIDRGRDARGKSLWWGKRIALRSFQKQQSEIAPYNSSVQKFFDAGTHILLNEDKGRSDFYDIFDRINWKEIENVKRHAVAFEFARLKSTDPERFTSTDEDSRIADTPEREELMYSDWKASSCPSSLSLIAKSADAGNPIAAYDYVKCTVKLSTLSAGLDFNAIAGDAYIQTMFYLAKAIESDFVPTSQYLVHMGGYEAEISKYVSVVRENGNRYTFVQFLEDYAARNGETASARAPSYVEIRAALNKQTLARMCTKAELLFSGDKTGNAQLTALIANEIGVRNGWCSTQNFGVRFDFRFGRINNMDCKQTRQSEFLCSITAHLDCKIESFRSTAPGNDLMCNILSMAPVLGQVRLTRLPDLSLRIGGYRPLESDHWY